MDNHYPLTALNLCRAELETKSHRVSDIWEEIWQLVRSYSEEKNSEERMLDCYLLIQREKGQWSFRSGQNLFIEALQGNGSCNCSCGVQLLLCLAEHFGLLGEIGEAKWRNHTTLAHQRPDSSVWILETTNVSPKWKAIEEVPKCHFITEFNRQKLFLHSLGELTNGHGKIKNIKKCIQSFPERFWEASGGALAWICWIWTTRAEGFRIRVFPLVEQAITLEQNNVGLLATMKVLTILHTTCTSQACRQPLQKHISEIYNQLNFQCPK